MEPTVRLNEQFLVIFKVFFIFLVYLIQQCVPFEIVWNHQIWMLLRLACSFYLGISELMWNGLSPKFLDSMFFCWILQYPTIWSYLFDLREFKKFKISEFLKASSDEFCKLTREHNIWMFKKHGTGNSWIWMFKKHGTWNPENPWQ